MHHQVQEMLAAGLIEKSSSPWASPAVMVPKAGKKHRMVIDMRKVNAAAKGNAYPLPKMREITAFTVPGLGLFQFKRMPYGLSNAGATFQRMIDIVIGPELEPYAFSYLDDIIIVA